MVEELMLSRSSLFSIPRGRQNFSLLPNSLRHLSSKQNIVLYILNDAKLFSRLHPPFCSAKYRAKPLTLAEYWHTEVSRDKKFFAISKIFYDDSCIFKLVSD